MATDELQSLRLRYRAAYTRYLDCVRAMADATEKGVWPESTALETERTAFEELCTARRLLFAALQRHTTESTS